MSSPTEGKPVSLDAILLIVALVCFLLAAFGVAAGRIAFGWLGLAFVTIAQLLPALGV